MLQFGDSRLPERFWRNVTENPLTGCWEANKPNKVTGYGQISFGRGKVRNRHKVAYEALIGPVPEGHQVDHKKCQNRPCCNPDHLEAVTQLVNIRRGFAFRPERTHCKRNHLLTPETTYVNPKGVRECRICRRALLHL